MAISEVTEGGVTFWVSDATTGYVIVYNVAQDWGRIYEADGSKVQTKDSIEEIATEQGATDRLNELGVEILS